jgi:ketosteroid isomerase-like protein
MAKLNPKKAKLFERKIRAHVKQFQDAYNGRKWNALARLIGDRTSLVLSKKKKALRGKSVILKFWRKAGVHGLQRVQFKIKKIQIRPADYLVLIGACYMSYDMDASVFGTYNFAFRKDGKLVDPPGDFYMTFGHQQVCWPDPGELYLDI